MITTTPECQQHEDGAPEDQIRSESVNVDPTVMDTDEYPKTQGDESDAARQARELFESMQREAMEQYELPATARDTQNPGQDQESVEDLMDRVVEEPMMTTLLEPPADLLARTVGKWRDALVNMGRTTKTKTRAKLRTY